MEFIRLLFKCTVKGTLILTDVLNTFLNTTYSHVCFQDVGRYFRTVAVYV